MVRLKDALREIRDYDSYKHPDESIIALREATIKESNECTACQHAKQAKWPPSGLCNKHYSLVTKAHDRVSQMFSYKQTWEPREIARRARRADEFVDTENIQSLSKMWGKPNHAPGALGACLFSTVFKL